MLPQRWTRRPEGATWGDFGPDDELGRLNLLTPQKVLEGVAEVRVGRSFCLSLPLDRPGGMVLSAARRPPRLAPLSFRAGKSGFNYALRDEDPLRTDVFSDDESLATQYSTHWDGLAHCGATFDADGDGVPEDVFYNGFRAEADLAGPPAEDYRGARHLGVENMAARCVQGRAVMIDLEAHFGRSGKVVSHAELMEAMAADGIAVEPGDMVCLHTGFADMVLEMNGRPDRDLLFSTTSALDGRDEALLRWITESGAVALIADNYAVEALPARSLPRPLRGPALHEHCPSGSASISASLHRRAGGMAARAWARRASCSQRRRSACSGAVAAPTTPVATV
jgi:hypothetical protein